MATTAATGTTYATLQPYSCCFCCFTIDIQLCFCCYTTAIQLLPLLPHYCLTTATTTAASCFAITKFCCHVNTRHANTRHVDTFTRNINGNNSTTSHCCPSVMEIARSMQL
eukprot:1156437-Pelagomonas_calceolata.AAC.8